MRTPGRGNYNGAVTTAAPQSFPTSVAPLIPWDEAMEPSGRPRDEYASLFDALDAVECDRLAGAVAERLATAGVCFGGQAQQRPFVVDPVPRLLTAAAWADLAAGIAQRARALNALLDDVSGPQRIVDAGVLSARTLESCEHHEPLMQGIPVPAGTRATVLGLDLVRTPDGDFAVLEDNARTPSGLAYALAAREAVSDALQCAFGDGHCLPEPRDLAPLVEALRAALRAADPSGGGDPAIVMLSDGPANSAFYEHRRLAGALGVPLVTLSDLEVRGSRLVARTDRSRAAQPVDVVYRRTDEDRLGTPDGGLTALGERLLGPMRAGQLTVCNAFGSGVADDKAVHGRVEALIEFYLDEKPLLASVPSLHLADPAARDEALERLDELVFKPRTGHGGTGVVIGPRARRDELDALREAVRDRPERFVAQEMVALSRHPTVVGSRLEPRHVDLRPFSLSAGEQVAVAPGGLTRFARRRDDLVVNSSRDGGGKDTWVLR